MTSYLARRREVDRLRRQAQKRKITSLLSPPEEEDAVFVDDESDEEHTDLQPPLPTTSSPSPSPSHPHPHQPAPLLNYEEDDQDHLDETREQTDTGPSLYLLSQIKLVTAVRRITQFISQSNLDKMTSVRLLRLIKDLLPQPNKLPTTWKRALKIIGARQTSITTFRCSKCLER